MNNMEQIVKEPSQNMSYVSYYVQNEAVGGNNTEKMLTNTEKMLTNTEPIMTAQLNTITAELLDMFLYGKRKSQEIDIEEAKRRKNDFYETKNDSKGCIWCEKCQSYHGYDAACHEPHNILRHLIGNTVHEIQLSYAVLSFPPEVMLCTSTIPGYTYGVCAKQPFPVGTWIGPYEGKRLLAEEVTTKDDSSYVWEIYEDGHFSHYLDGNDENISSWMRFIRCARHKTEQNMVVFQYGKNIYYRAVRDISAGVELLVWYNNNYTQFLGVPLGLPNVPGTKKDQSPTETTSPETLPSPQASQDEFKAFLKEQITKSLRIKAKAEATTQPHSYMASNSITQQPNISNGNYTILQATNIPQETYGTLNIPQATHGPPHIPQGIHGSARIPHATHGPPHISRSTHSPPNIPHVIQGAPNIPQATQIPQVMQGAPNLPQATQIPQVMQGAPNMPQAIPRTVNGNIPQVINGTIINTVPIQGTNISQSMNYARQIQTTSTYCYSAVNPTQSQVAYMNLNSVQPTVTIDHRPILTQADETPRQQYILTSNSGNTVNTNYSMSPINQHPTITTSTTTFQEDRTSSPRDQSVSMKCNQCQQTFNQMSLFQMHMCCKSPEKPFECGHCSEAFATTSELGDHVLTHTKERPFKCGFCGSSFSTSATLNTHMQIHSIERSFRCQNCRKTFSMATQLSRHMRTPGKCSGIVDEYKSEVETPFTSTLTRG